MCYVVCIYYDLVFSALIKVLWIECLQKISRKVAQITKISVVWWKCEKKNCLNELRKSEYFINNRFIIESANLHRNNTTTKVSNKFRGSDVILLKRITINYQFTL